MRKKFGRSAEELQDRDLEALRGSGRGGQRQAFISFK